MIIEVIASRSRGIGITGGEPLVRFDKLVKVIKELKEFFGNEFHIHLYTSGTLLKKEYLDRLVRSGLDELRVHIISERSWDALKIALDFPIDVGIENPSIPNLRSWIKDMVRKAYELGVKFINLNELEFSESNMNNLLMRGFKLSDDGVTAVGSKELALEILNWVIDEGMDLNIHFCPARFKDKYQFRLRLNHRARTTLRPFEYLSNGIVKWAEIVECPGNLLSMLIEYGLAFILEDKVLSHIDVADALSCKYKIIEAYPTHERRVLNITLSNEFKDKD